LFISLFTKLLLSSFFFLLLRRMKSLLSLFAASLYATAVLSAPISDVVTAPAKGYRLLATSDKQPPFWVAPEAAEALGTTELNYMDITDFQEVDVSLTPTAIAIPSGPTHQSTVAPLLAQIDTELYESKLTTLASFRNRYYTAQTGLDSANWIYDQVLAITANRSDISVTKFAHTWLQPSLIARIEGTSSVRDLVILGAHQDSTAGGMPSGSAPGADDDGSGSIAIYEILRILSSSGFRPQHPIEFHWYSAEEVGLLGSQAVANNYQSRAIPVRGMMQLDMIAYNARESTVGIVTDFVDADTIDFNRKLVDEYLDIGWTNTVCGYGCSDHASWTRYGYRSSFPFEAQFSRRNPFIHTTQDTMDFVAVEHAKEFVKLGLAFAVEMSYI
jgi:leucyl aminopeptidase